MRRFALLAWVLGGALACGPRTKEKPAVGPPVPTYTPPAAKCAESGQSAPLIVDWPSAERTRIESAAKSGVVLLRYKGCAISVVGQCATRAKRAYAWVGTTRKRDHLVFTDRDELYANLPLGAASLEGTLARTQSLDVDMTIVGRYEADAGTVRADDLIGDGCTEATHVVTGITIGSFRFFAGASGKAGASAGAFGAKAGGSTATEHEVLAEDGDESACTAAKSVAAGPPASCAAPLRLELVPIGATKKAAPDCGPGTTWDGTQCKDADATPKCVAAESALAVCTTLCATDDDRACVTLGTIYLRRKEPAFAVAAYQKACDRGVGEGCSELAAFHLEEKDALRAAALFARGCDLHDPQACTWLGHMHRMSLVPDASATASTSWYTRGCDAGDSFACYWLADALLEGRGTAKDPARANLLLDRLCAKNNALACMKLKKGG